MTASTQKLFLSEPQVNAHGDRYFVEINGTTFRDRSAVEIYDERFGPVGFRQHSLHIICGTDSGLLPRYLLSRPELEGSHFLFLELPEVIEELAGTLPEVEAAENLHIVSLKEFRHVAEALDIEHFFYRKALFLVPSFAILHSAHRSYADLAWRSQQVIDEISLNLGIRLNNRFFFLTMLNNLAENRTPVTALRGKFSGRTAVVLGAGPSLDVVLPWVEQNRARLDVFAVSRTSRRLLEAGISPDFVFSIDPQAVSFDIGKHMLRFGRDTAFVNNTHACPQLVGQWPWRSLYWGARVPWGPAPSVSPGNTVTHLAVWTAVVLGYHRVILGGVDLCFTREGHTHAQGSAERDAGPNLLRGAVEVETNRGDLAETDHQLSQGIAEMGRVAAIARQRGTRILNPAGSAARIPNVQFVPFDELPTPENRQSAADILRRVLDPEDREARSAYYRTTLEEVNKVRRDLRRIQGWSRNAIRQIRQAFKGESPAAFQKHNRKIDAAEKRIRETYPHLRSTLIQLQAGDFIDVLRPKKQEWTTEEIEEVSRKVFDGYIRSADDLIEHLRSVETRLEVRLAEEDGRSADLDRLIEQWRQDRQPARFSMVRRRNPQLAERLERERADAVGDLNQAFEESMAAARTFPVRFEPETVRVRAQSLWERGDLEGMKRLVSGLEELSSDEAVALSHLLAGYVSEISKDTRGALRHYDRVSAEAFPKAREDALRRTSAIALRERDGAMATNALKELTALSPIYRPQLANLLRLTGRHQEAVEEYARHMAASPQDTDTMLRLGDLYRDLGAEDAAQMAYEYALALHPQKAAARDRMEALRRDGGEP